MHHRTWPIFVFLVEAGFFRVGQFGLKLSTSGDPPTSVSQSAGITDVSHGAWPAIDSIMPSRHNRDDIRWIDRLISLAVTWCMLI